MEYPKPKISIGKEEFEVLSLDEFRVKRGMLTTPNQTLSNHMVAGTLDYTTIGRFRYIIWNEKAQQFNLNYQKQLNS